LPKFNSLNLTNGSAVSLGFSVSYNAADTVKEYQNKKISLDVGLGIVEGDISTDDYGNISGGVGGIFFPDNIISETSEQIFKKMLAIEK